MNRLSGIITGVIIVGAGTIVFFTLFPNVDFNVFEQGNTVFEQTNTDAVTPSEPSQENSPTLTGNENDAGTAFSKNEDDKNATDMSPPSWYVFWEPFRTHLSAQGFATRVEQMVGVSIKVIEQANTKFMIAFPYRDDAEKDEILRLIEEKTRFQIKNRG